MSHLLKLAHSDRGALDLVKSHISGLNCPPIIAETLDALRNFFNVYGERIETLLPHISGPELPSVIRLTNDEAYTNGEPIMATLEATESNDRDYEIIETQLHRLANVDIEHTIGELTTRTSYYFAEPSSDAMSVDSDGIRVTKSSGDVFKDLGVFDEAKDGIGRRVHNYGLQRDAAEKIGMERVKAQAKKHLRHALHYGMNPMPGFELTIENRRYKVMEVTETDIFKELAEVYNRRDHLAPEYFGHDDECRPPEAKGGSAPAPIDPRVANDPCVRKLRPDEPFFVLLGRDVAAYKTLCQWKLARRAYSKATENIEDIIARFEAYTDKIEKGYSA